MTKQKLSDLLSSSLKANISWLRDGSIAFTTEKTIPEVRAFLSINNLDIVTNGSHVVSVDKHGVDLAQSKVDSL